MKKSLAPPRPERRIGTRNNNSSSQKSISGASSERSPLPSQRNIAINTDRNEVQRFQQRYRNKNINVLPTQMLVALSGLFTLDISYNKLTDSQIELIMNSCLKLVTFCMQGNQTTIIPAAIYKLSELKNFRHDWLAIDPRQMYESEQRLHRLQIVAKREKDSKAQKLVGVNFATYCTQILCISMDNNLLARIERCDSTTFAKQNMLKHMFGQNQNNLKNCFGKAKPKQSKTLIPGCFGILDCEEGDASREIQQGTKHHSLKKGNQQTGGRTEIDSERSCKNIKIEDIRDLCESSFTNATSSEKTNRQIDEYNSPGMPLHKLFSSFDKNSQAPAEIDALLLEGLNPNQYDQNGLSPYHICIIYRQMKGFQYLLEISSNNPGFFDLEMPSIHDGKNILHLSVFLKNFKVTKDLIEFGLPCNNRDSSGSRIQHLVDQNKEFRLLLRKLLKKKTEKIRNNSYLSIPSIRYDNKKHYIKHPQRHRQQSRLTIVYSKNDKLLEMFEHATGVRR